MNVASVSTATRTTHMAGEDVRTWLICWHLMTHEDTITCRLTRNARGVWYFPSWSQISNNVTVEIRIRTQAECPVHALSAALVVEQTDVYFEHVLFVQIQRHLSTVHFCGSAYGITPRRITLQYITCDVMWCDVMWCDVMWCDVMRCDVIQCDAWHFWHIPPHVSC